MLQINTNIKLIRELSRLKQEDFARLIKTNLSNLKTYETTEVRPKADVLARIADLAGITVDDLDRKLTHKDLKLDAMKVEKVEVLSRAEEPAPVYLTQNQTDVILEELRMIRRSTDKLIDQQGMLVDTNKRMADRLLSLESSGNTDENFAGLQALRDLILQVGVKAGSWKSAADGLDRLNKIVRENAQSKKAAGRRVGTDS